MSARRKQKGVMLIIVLWLLTLLTVMAMGFSSSIRTEVRSMRNIIDKAKADHLADAAIQRGIFRLINADPESLQSHDGSIFSFNYAGERLQYQIWDERGKIDLNIATEMQLQALFMSFDFDSNRANSLTGAIIDWRDEDKLRHLNGAEASEYINAGLRSRPSNRPFQSVAELQQVMGVDEAIYTSIAPLVSVHSYGDKINPAVAPKAALLALPDVNPIEVETLIEARAQRANNPTIEPLPKLTGVSQWLTNAVGPVYTIRGRVQLSSGAQSNYEQVIWLPAKEGLKSFYVLESKSVDNRLE
jgi:general secretion pathway protein K